MGPLEATRPARDYCRGCSGQSRQTFAGWATGSGHENTVRPRAFYRVCDPCGLVRLVLGFPSPGGGHVNDAEGLCRNVLREWLRRRATDARVGSTTVLNDGALDAEDALAFLNETIWGLYLKWEPAAGVTSFLSYASGLLPKRLDQWSRHATGEPDGRRKWDHERGKERGAGRVHPKAHAASVCVSLDGLLDADAGEATGAGRLDRGAGSLTADDTEDRAFDLLRAFAAGDGDADGVEREGRLGAPGAVPGARRGADR